MNLENRAPSLLTIEEHAFEILRDIAKWARFLAIAGYVALGFLLLLGLITGFVLVNSMEMSMGIFVFVFYSLFVTVYIFPVYYLHQFSKNVSLALTSNDSTKLTEALLFLKSHYKFLGILTMILLGLYVVVMFSTIVSGILANI